MTLENITKRTLGEFLEDEGGMSTHGAGEIIDSSLKTIGTAIVREVRNTYLDRDSVVYGLRIAILTAAAYSALM